MKKTLLLIVFAFLALSSQAQGTRLGVCLNPMIQWFSENVDLLDKDGVKFGIEGGLVVEHYFTKNYAINTGIRIGNQGGKLLYNESYHLTSDESDSLFQKVNYKLQYITIPVGLKMKTNPVGYFSYFALLGFTPQINIGAKANVSGNKDDFNVGKEISPFNLSYHFGGGIEYNIGGNTAITLGIVYNNGFIDILTKQGEKEKLSFLSMQVGVMF